MIPRQVEQEWLKNFIKSPLVKNGAFDAELGYNLFYGFEGTDHGRFSRGFHEFYASINPGNTEAQIDELLEFLHFIGITIHRQSLLEAIQNKSCSFRRMLKKAFYIFKRLARFGEELDIHDPYFDNRGDLLFFIRLEENHGDPCSQVPKNKTVTLQHGLPELPANYNEDHTAEKLFNLLENTNDSFFLTGKAGTGKSTFIQYFNKNTSKQVLVVSFTGIAAINIGGQTIHSFFRFPLKPLLPNDHHIPIFSRNHPHRKVIEKADSIIIDEVSMLRSDLLEGIDYSLRNNGGDPTMIFGGKQMIFVGDIFQLPPVVKLNDPVEREIFRTVYQSEYFFDSHAYKNLDPSLIELQKIHRQQDQSFIELLNKVRDCSIKEEEIAKLNQRIDQGYSFRPGEPGILLTSANHAAKFENRKKLKRLPFESHYFKATIKGDFPEDRYPAEPLLELRNHAQVMLVRNDSETNGRRWVNGTIAKIVHVDDQKIKISLPDGSIHTLQKEVWENRHYHWDKSKGIISSLVIGSFEQYPIKLAWAITIHKSQGLTFDNVIIDLGTGAFANGQLYTALSRCRSMSGLILKRKIRRRDIIEDRRLNAFYEITRARSLITIE